MEILLLIIIGVVVAFILQAEQERNKKEKLEKVGIDMQKAIPLGKYICGHPEISDPTPSTFILEEGDVLQIYREGIAPNSFMAVGYTPLKLGLISKKQIEDILLEDASTIERHVTVGRLALVGLFAFALKKNKKSELAYVVIKWKDGKFKHETIFEFEGKGGIAQANKARNSLIKICND